MAQTAESLTQALQNIWNYDTMARQMYDEQSGLRNIVSGTSRFYVDHSVPEGQIYSVNVDMSPAAVRERERLLSRELKRLGLEQARVKRGNKPSYRQRQRNGRKAAGR